jgi:hypothetical protein
MKMPRANTAPTMPLRFATATATSPSAETAHFLIQEALHQGNL